ncbi:nitroreductase [Asanoa ishikariensis]|uniref:Deazaflavin-dependent oxidoreductase, nitroreductase family n=1 Tax=Asanoa ishikariensis TaxID=137265 RepID=A0A1H3V068_9ACTN|nr:nitroreductase/quinone reductase family protein [Asanoa ishikariensis]GIF70079.1 nitroreductase [Asanoa ishikariensis]SDZ67479.1 deazaflavin-dependent oxidoreductase, nitroreductase family [Asanoa ishikariensis]
MAIQRRVVNPVVRLAWTLRLPIPGDALLETTGRRSGKPRRTPVCDGSDGEAFWLVSQHGRDADWVRNVEADPRVRVKVSRGRWRTGVARLLPDDDPAERRRILAHAGLARRLCLATAGLSDTSPLTVRIDLDPD